MTTAAWKPLLQYHQIVVRGDDCTVANGRALTWHCESWPSLEGATITIVTGFNTANIFGSLPVTWENAGTTVAKEGQKQTVSMPLSHAQTEQVLEGTFDYQLKAKLSDGSIVTLALGHIAVLAPPGQAPVLPLT